MAYTPVRPTDPLDNPSHSGLHNQHATDLEALQAFRELFAGGDAGEVLAKTTNDDYDIEWLPGGTGGGGDGGDYPGISSEDPNGLGLGTDGGLRVEPADLLSDNEGQQLKVAADDGKLHMAYDIVDAVPEDDDTTYSIGDVVFVTGPGDGGSPSVGGGKVLQVVSKTVRGFSTTAASGQPVTDCFVKITPSSTSSKIWLSVTTSAMSGDAITDSVACVYKNGAEMLSPSQMLYAHTTQSNYAAPGAWSTLDNPATTSEITYQVMLRSSTAGKLVSIGMRGDGGYDGETTITAFEVGA